MADRLKSEGPAPRGSPLAVTAAVVQREFVRHMQQCHLLRGKLHDGGALCQVPARLSTLTGPAARLLTERAVAKPACC